MTFSPVLPDTSELESYRIWDSHLHLWPSADPADSLSRQMEVIDEYVERMGVERLCAYLHVGLGTYRQQQDPPDQVRKMERENRELLERWPKLLGFVWLNPNRVRDSLDALNRWVADGPMVAIKFGGGETGTLKCNHPNFHPLMERAAELNVVIYQHTWLKAGGLPVIPGGGNNPGESTPQELVELARRYPELRFICGHAGGDWEVGIRAVRSQPNIWLETAGNDPTDGIVQMAVRELGPERIVFGGHLPSRSFGTELSKILTTSLGREDKQRILGANLRDLLRPTLLRKGLTVDPDTR